MHATAVVETNDAVYRIGDVAAARGVDTFLAAGEGEMTHCFTAVKAGGVEVVLGALEIGERYEHTAAVGAHV